MVIIWWLSTCVGPNLVIFPLFSPLVCFLPFPWPLIWILPAMEIISKIQNNRRTPLRILKQTTEFDIQHPIWSPRQRSPTSKMPSSIMSSSRHHWSSRSSPVSFSPSSPMSYNPWQPIDSSHLSVSSSNLTSSPQSRPAPRSPSKTLPISAAFEIWWQENFER